MHLENKNDKQNFCLFFLASDAFSSVQKYLKALDNDLSTVTSEVNVVLNEFPEPKNSGSSASGSETICKRLLISKHFH